MNSYPVIKTTNNVVTVRPQIARRNVSSSEVEDIIASRLLTKFPRKIHQYKSIGPYYPDILFIDSQNNIYIDIEIDEPYSLSGELTHCVDTDKDENRDSFFTRSGYNVIRFSEKQVKCHLDDIVSFFGQLIMKFKTRQFNVENFKHQYKHIKDSQWDHQKAEEYFKQRIRDHYLHDILPIPEADNICLEISETIESTMQNIISSYSKLDLDSDVVLIPYLISDIYQDREQNCWIELDCTFSETISYCPFGRPPRLKISKSKSENNFDFFLDKKKANRKIRFSNNDYGHYDFFIKSTYSDINKSDFQICNYSINKLFNR